MTISQPIAGPARLMLPLEPSEEEQLIRRAVGGIASTFGRRYLVECHEAGEPPVKLWDSIAAHGFVGVNLPEEHGGGGLGMTGLAIVAEELSRHGLPMLLLVVSPAIAGSILARRGTDSQRRRWLPGIAAGTERIAFAVTEPDAGTNTHRITTHARPTPDGAWTINGQKTFISAVEHATAILVVARAAGPDGILGKPALFIVDVDSPGLTRQPVPTALRLADRQWMLHFDDVVVPPERLIGGAAGGIKALFDGLNPERIMIAAQCIGSADLALTLATRYAGERTVWDRPIGAHQAIAHPLAECKVEIETARLMLAKACALYDAGSPDAGEAANMAKLVAADANVHTVDRAIQTHGGNGVALEFGISDLWWGARTNMIAPVSREMILNHIAEHSLGLPKSY